MVITTKHVCFPCDLTYLLNKYDKSRYIEVNWTLTNDKLNMISLIL